MLRLMSSSVLELLRRPERKEVILPQSTSLPMEECGNYWIVHNIIHVLYSSSTNVHFFQHTQRTARAHYADNSYWISMHPYDLMWHPLNDCAHKYVTMAVGDN